MSVGHVSPEAAAGGPIAVVRNGDVISIDLERRSIDLELSEEEFDKRMSVLPPFMSKIESRWLRRYSKLVTSASTGAVLED